MALTSKFLHDIRSYLRSLAPIRPRLGSWVPLWLEQFQVILATKFRFLVIQVCCGAIINMNRYSLSRGFSPQHRLHYDIAGALTFRFEANRNIEDLNEAIEHYRAAIYLMIASQLNTPPPFEVLRLYGYALNTRFIHLGQMIDLEEAISRMREGLTIAPPEHISRIQLMGNLGASLLDRFERTSNAEDQVEGIRLLQETIESPLADRASAKSLALANLGGAYFSAFILHGRKEDLDQAAAFLQTSVQNLSITDPARMRALYSLGHLLMHRYNIYGDNMDLDTGILYLQGALQTRPPGSAERGPLLRILAISLIVRFHAKRQLQDLEDAIDGCRQAVDQSIPGSLLYCEALVGLSVALVNRSEETGNLGDIHEALALCKGALKDIPQDSPHLSTVQLQLSNVLCNQFSITGSEETLEQAIKIRETFASQTSEGQAKRTSNLWSLANLYFTRFRLSRNLEDLDKPAEILGGIIASLPEGNLFYPFVCVTFVQCLNTRFAIKGDMDDLLRSISLSENTLASLPDGHTMRSSINQHLAVSLWQRSQVSGEGEASKHDCDRAMDLFRQGAEQVTSRVSDRLQSAVTWAQCARKSKHRTSLEAYRTSLALNELSLLLTPTIQLQQEFLSGAGYRGAPTLAMDAASCALDENDIETAVEMLEQGRALIWSEVRGLRTPLDRLAGVPSALRHKFFSVARELDALVTSSSRTAIPDLLQSIGSESAKAPELSSDILSGGLDQMYSRKRALATEFQAIISEIRSIPGFSDFLLAKPFSELREAALEGPVILVNHSIYRSDAIIIPDNVQKPVSIRLPDEFFRRIFELESLLVSSRQTFELDSKEYNEALLTTMTELWDLVVGRVVDELKNLGVKEQSRIWWCPTSSLTGLPLHAAAKKFTLDNEEKYVYFSDTFVPSYTPTLSALINARSRTSQLRDSGARPLFLVVGQPDETLKSVKKEVRRIEEVATSGTCIAKLMRSKGTLEAVKEKLQNCEWVHFACHGHLVPGDPFNSSFQLFNDSRLTLLDIVKANIPNAEFAFLSACHTAEHTQAASREEVLNLATAMQFCGLKSVIGTMWAMKDEDAPVVAEKFYAYLLSKESKDKSSSLEVGFKGSARALCETTRFMRQDGQYRRELERWVNFIHIGA